ncbi:DUF934 domain-containing protein [Spongorhabdus nitratireducens]
MRRIIKDKQIVSDSFTVVAKDAEGDLPEGNLLLPLQLWLQRKELKLAAENEYGVWIDSDQDPFELKDQLEDAAAVAVNFPVFSDGRGYSSGRLIRERLGYTGELRAIGDVLLDQLFFMLRCGFNAYAVRSDRCIEEALQGLEAFSLSYQGANDKAPLFRVGAA